MRFRNQCEHWWRKHFLPSAGRPETPLRFRPAQSPPLSLKRRAADFERLYNVQQIRMSFSMQCCTIRCGGCLSVTMPLNAESLANVL